jgi:hypothetical protein
MEAWSPKLGVLPPKFFRKNDRIMVSDNPLFMRAEVNRQDMQQCVLSLGEVQVELLLFGLGHDVKVKELRVPLEAPPVLFGIALFGDLVSQH